MKKGMKAEVFAETLLESNDNRDRYTVGRHLGEGSFGEVRHAIDTITGADVAIKYVRLMSKTSKSLPKAVFREIEALKQLADSDNIISVLDLFGTESCVCIVMEYMISDVGYVISHTPFPLHRGHLKAYYRMMLAAVKHCHDRNIIHRDIKPSSKPARHR